MYERGTLYDIVDRSRADAPAMINGYCFGGGLELAHGLRHSDRGRGSNPRPRRRSISESSPVAVRSQRLARLVGLGNALKTHARRRSRRRQRGAPHWARRRKSFRKTRTRAADIRTRRENRIEERPSRCVSRKLPSPRPPASRSIKAFRFRAESLRPRHGVRRTRKKACVRSSKARRGHGGSLTPHFQTVIFSLSAAITRGEPHNNFLTFVLPALSIWSGIAAAGVGHRPRFRLRRPANLGMARRRDNCESWSGHVPNVYDRLRNRGTRRSRFVRRRAPFPDWLADDGPKARAMATLRRRCRPGWTCLKNEVRKLYEGSPLVIAADNEKSRLECGVSGSFSIRVSLFEERTPRLLPCPRRHAGRTDSARIGGLDRAGGGRTRDGSFRRDATRRGRSSMMSQSFGRVSNVRCLECVCGYDFVDEPQCGAPR